MRTIGKAVCAATLLGLAWMVPAQAEDVVHTKNGAVLRGQIVDVEQQALEIKVDPDDEQSPTIKIDRKDVRWIQRDGRDFTLPPVKKVAPPTDADAGTPPAPSPQPGDPAPPTGTPGEETTPPAAEEPDPRLEPVYISKKLQKQVKLLIPKLAADTREARSQAASALARLGSDIAPILVEEYKANEDSLAIQTNIMEILGTIKNDRSIQFLIENLGCNIRNQRRSKQAYLSLKKVTGQSFYFDEDDSVRQQNASITEWQAWFKRVEKDYPLQIGHKDFKVIYGAKPIE
jgi:hypothetical protein